ncbi:MAG: hypothetical protein HY532_08435 [Chloroflexi bacterium]|nr:hypothetical protein [Chloroflexota bacterium]
MSGSKVGVALKGLRQAAARRMNTLEQGLDRFKAGLTGYFRVVGTKVVRTAELAGWAPTAVIACLLAGVLVSVSVTWLTFEFWLAFSTGTARVLVLASLGLSAIVLLGWFATSPKVSATVRRFWGFTKFVVVVMGLAVLGVAFNNALGYFS